MISPKVGYDHKLIPNEPQMLLQQSSRLSRPKTINPENCDYRKGPNANRITTQNRAISIFPFRAMVALTINPHQNQDLYIDAESNHAVL